MECHPPIRTGHKLGVAMPNFSHSTGHSLGYSRGYPHDIPLNSIKSSCLTIKPPLFHIIPQIFGHLRNWVKRAEKKQAVMFMDGGDRESLRMVLVQGRGKKPRRSAQNGAEGLRHLPGSFWYGLMVI
jgi:hypothetical protein